MNPEALRDKLKQITDGGYRYPALEIPHNTGGGPMYIRDRSHVYSSESPILYVNAGIYNSIMTSTSLDGELYMMLTGIGMSTYTALTASLKYD